MFSDVVLGISKDEFEKVLDEVKEKEHVNTMLKFLPKV